jgi:hypothetical protein
MAYKKNSQPAAELRTLAQMTAHEAISPMPNQTALLEVANRLAEKAGLMERKRAPAIAVLPSNATESEIGHKRRTQAVRVDKEVFLPSWKSLTHIMPSAFLRSALFSSGRSVQSNWASDPEATSLLVSNKKIATSKDVTMTLSGYELCQFDRRVYSTCLDFYRERPLAQDGQDLVQTTFYAFALRMGGLYGSDPHKAIRASLLRLSLAQIRLRTKSRNLELPKLLSVSFDELSNGETKGSDCISIQVPESIAELFGHGSWTSIDTTVSRYDGLKGWLGCFYSSHSKEMALPVTYLHRLSGYDSHLRNFQDGVIRALDKLKESDSPRITYTFNKGDSTLLVKCTRQKSDR